MSLTIIPENLEVANVYLRTNNIDETARQLGISKERCADILSKKQTADYITQVYLDTGYRNRFTLASALDEMIRIKMEEGMETGFYSKADLLELLQFAHKIRMDEIKASQTTVNQTNVQINNEFGQGNYGELMKKLMAPT